MAELDQLIRLYRQTSGDLAIAQRDFPGDRLVLFLNQLVSRAYGVIYQEPPAPLSQLRRFFVRELPREYRAAWPYLTASAALLFIPMVLAALLVILAPDRASLILPSGLLSEIKSGHTWFDASSAERPALASFIMTHNVQIALLAFASGVLGGVGPIYILIDNGIQIGAVAGALIAYGLGDALVGFVSPHGFLELSIVVVSGAGGLMLGRAVVWPGLQTRGAALTAAGQRAVRLLLGLLPFLGIAGLLEGFVSPSHFAWPFKLAIGLLTAVVLYGYVLRAGRGEKPRL